jgi:hypothetical protein
MGGGFGGGRMGGGFGRGFAGSDFGRSRGHFGHDRGFEHGRRFDHDRRFARFGFEPDWDYGYYDYGCNYGYPYYRPYSYYNCY